MPALVTMRHNDRFGAKAEGPRKRGKLSEVVITAIRYKLIVIANTMFTKNGEWGDTNDHHCYHCGWCLFYRSRLLRGVGTAIGKVLHIAIAQRLPQPRV